MAVSPTENVRIFIASIVKLRILPRDNNVVKSFLRVLHILAINTKKHFRSTSQVEESVPGCIVPLQSRRHGSIKVHCQVREDASRSKA